MESPLFDKKHREAGDEVRTVEIKNSKITKILTNTDSDGWLFGKTRFKFEDGSETIFYDKGNTSGSEQARDIPENYYIVGVYGRFGSYINNPGFIVAKFE